MDQTVFRPSALCLNYKKYPRTDNSKTRSYAEVVVGLPSRMVSFLTDCWKQLQRRFTCAGVGLGASAYLEVLQRSCGEQPLYSPFKIAKNNSLPIIPLVLLRIRRLAISIPPPSHCRTFWLPTSMSFYQPTIVWVEEKQVFQQLIPRRHCLPQWSRC